MKRRQPEADLQRAVISYLTLCVPQPPAGPWWTAVASRPRATARQGAYRKALGERTGVPDLIFCWRGEFLGIELKAGKGRLSPAQQDCHADIHAAGGLAYVVRSLDELVACLARHRIPHRRLAA